MKAVYFALVSTLLATVQAQVSWYVSSRNITCTGGSSGAIVCQQGHIDNAPEVTLNHPDTAAKRDITPAIRGRAAAAEAVGLQKRVTCNIESVSKGLACFTHCFAIGYCNSHCDSNNICHCTCMDKTPWWNPLVCSKTSCA